MISDPKPPFDRLGDYEVLAPIAEGGMASVWLGRSAAGESVALKVIREDHGRNKDFVAMLVDEAGTRTNDLEVWWSLSDTSVDDLLNHPVVSALLERFADLLAQRLRANSAGSDGYYTTKSNPLGSARAFRDAARRGHFPSFKLVRMVAAKKTDGEDERRSQALACVRKGAGGNAHDVLESVV